MEEKDENVEVVEQPRLIVISGPIDFDTVGRIAEQMAMMNAISSDPITVHVTSTGGIMDAGTALHDMLALSRAPVTTEIWGCADSAAVLAVQAGKVRLMAPNATMLLHKGSLGMEGRFNESELSKLRKMSAKNDDRYAALVARRSGLEVATISAWCEQSTTLNADQALRHGLVDAVIGRRRRRPKGKAKQRTV